MVTLTEEMKRDIVRDYADRTMPMRDLEGKYGIPRAQIAKIAVEAGAEPRRAKAWGKRIGHKRRICPKCHEVININGARFCYVCGTDVRSETDILTERLEKVISYVRYLPENLRDEVRDTILAAINVITK